ncbi:MAG TPA: YlxR family protein [Desulfobacterales bacterium]|nr:YlxR family protein [Desulfobacterales bacterium]HIP40186.1 YlxR family protein [Desulfocapsa sulfexigens]
MQKRLKKETGKISKIQPVRTCIVCRRQFVKEKLQRYVWNFDTENVVLDSRQNMAGRGAYCCMDEKCEQMFLTGRQRWKRAFRLN